MRLWLGVLCEYGDYLGSDRAGGPGEGLPATLHRGGSYKQPLTRAGERPALSSTSTSGILLAPNNTEGKNPI